MTVKAAGGCTTVKEFNDLQSALAYQRSFHPKLTLQALGEELKDMPSGADIVKAMAISAIDPSSVVGVTIEALAEKAGLSESDASIIGNRTETIVASASFGFGLAKLAKAVEKRLAKSGIKRAAKRAAEKSAAIRAGRNAARNIGSASTRVSSRALGQALEASGHVVRPAESAAHHIVAGNARAASQARAVLQRFGIGIDDAANGVFLPASRAAPNAAGAAVHSTVHTNAYYQTVNQMLGAATTRAEVEAVLDAIRQALLSGGL